MIEVSMIDKRFQTFQQVFVVAVFAVLIDHRFASNFEREVAGTVFGDFFVAIENHPMTFRLELFPACAWNHQDENNIGNTATALT